MRVVSMDTIREFGKRIGKDFRPEKVILFGSYAYGSPKEESDVDLLVILDFEGKSFRKSLEILNKIDPHFAVDLIVRNPEDTRERYAQGDPMIKEALDRGMVLYERRDRRMA